MTVTSSLLYRSGKHSGHPFVLTGPVIGAVTDTTARVLIETNASASVECTLTPETGPAVKQSISIKNWCPKSFFFTGLQPCTYYRVSLSIPCPGLIQAGFRTLPTGWTLATQAARIAFVTANNYNYTRDHIPEATDLWKKLYKAAARRDIDYLIHLGDNVYIDNDDYKYSRGRREFVGVLDDNRWQTALDYLKSLPPAEWKDHYEELSEVFRGCYRETWNHPTTKQALANVPNLMLLNDHDIHLGFGDLLADSDPYSLEYFAASCAYDVYNQYQRNLFEDYTPRGPYKCTDVIHQAYHFHSMGELGFMGLDLRCAKTFHQGHSKPLDRHGVPLPLIGTRQMEDIEFALSDEGYYADCRMLFVAAPTPPCVTTTGTSLTRRGGMPVPKAGAWWPAEHGPETSYFLSLLFDWKAKQPGLREVCIVAGGVGIGCVTDIFDVRYGPLKDSRLDRVKQLILAPIAADPDVPTYAAKLLMAAGSRISRAPPHHQFKHYNRSSHTRQYAVVDVYLDYNETCPEFGIMTQYTIQLTGATADKVTAVRPLNNTYRIPAAFSGTFLGCCDGGRHRRRAPLRPSLEHSSRRRHVPFPPAAFEPHYTLRSLGSTEAEKTRASLKDQRSNAIESSSSWESTPDKRM